MSIEKLIDLCDAVVDECNPVVPSRPLVELTNAINNGLLEGIECCDTEEQMAFMDCVVELTCSWSSFPEHVYGSNSALIDPYEWLGLAQRLQAYKDERVKNQ